MEIGLVVPVLSNFAGFAQLMNSVDTAVTPIVLDNWNGNRGVAASWNEGIRKGFGLDVVIISNDDVAFYPGTIKKIAQPIKEEEFDLLSVVATDTGQHGFLEDAKPDFCCFAINPERFVDQFGMFDENFKPAYFEDNDMYYRIKLAGGRSALRLSARVDHGGSVTQFSANNEEGRVVSHEQFRKNQSYYSAKWGGIPGSETFTHPFNMGHRDIKDWTQRD